MSSNEDRSSGATIRRFSSVIAAVKPLLQFAEDWREGFAARTDMTHTIGHSTGDSRVFSDAVTGMTDHVEDKVTRQVKAVTIPEREGHGLADDCARVARDIEAWIVEGNHLAREVQRLLPKDHAVAMTLVKNQAVTLMGAGVCQRCGRDVPGIVEAPIYGIKPDRLKSGFCYGQEPHCYDAWRRRGMRDRARFIQEWKDAEAAAKAAAGARETPGASTTAPDAVQLSGSGGEVSPDTGAA